MRFQLLGHWPVGQWLVPAGTMITGPDFQWADTGIKLPQPLPINARALDDAAWKQLCAWYPQQIHMLSYDPTAVEP
jgi:hypothetical protein